MGVDLVQPRGRFKRFLIHLPQDEEGHAISLATSSLTFVPAENMVNWLTTAIDEDMAEVDRLRAWRLTMEGR